MVSLPHVTQPEIINISTTLFIRKYDGNYHFDLPWYRNLDIYYNFECLFDEIKIPNLNICLVNYILL